MYLISIALLFKTIAHPFLYSLENQKIISPVIGHYFKITHYSGFYYLS